MIIHPLAEVFGFPATNFSAGAERYRANRLCPYNNRVPSCTKDKANDPLGVCSIFDGEQPVITCPIRFRQEWLIAEDAARFFFPPENRWTSLTEVRLNDLHGRSAGNIDVVIVAHDQNGKVLDFGALEVQAVYISGNVRLPFAEYMSRRHEKGLAGLARRAAMATAGLPLLVAQEIDASTSIQRRNPGRLGQKAGRCCAELVFRHSAGLASS